MPNVLRHVQGAAQLPQHSLKVQITSLVQITRSPIGKHLSPDHQLGKLSPDHQLGKLTPDHQLGKFQCLLLHQAGRGLLWGGHDQGPPGAKADLLSLR